MTASTVIQVTAMTHDTHDAKAFASDGNDDDDASAVVVPAALEAALVAGGGW